MRLIVKMISLNTQKNNKALEGFKLTPKQQRHIEISNQLKKDGYKILPVSVEEFLR